MPKEVFISLLVRQDNTQHLTLQQHQIRDFEVGIAHLMYYNKKVLYPIQMTLFPYVSLNLDKVRLKTNDRNFFRFKEREKTMD